MFVLVRRSEWESLRRRVKHLEERLKRDTTAIWSHRHCVRCGRAYQQADLRERFMYCDAAPSWLYNGYCSWRCWAEALQAENERLRQERAGA